MHADSDNPFDDEDMSEAGFSLSDPVVERACRDAEKSAFEAVRRDDERLRHQPPRTFSAEHLPPKCSWLFANTPEHKRWMTIQGERIRTLLHADLEDRWPTLVSDSSSPILLLGQTGVGKEATAKLIHNLGPRHGRPLLSIGARELTDTLITTRLHGCVKGSHSTSLETQPGLFREADGGTLVIHDIDENHALQKTLLTFMDDHLAKPEGGKYVTYKVDVKLIVTTNKNPDDVHYLQPDFRRRFIWEFCVPPLRERDPVDSAMLLQEYLRDNQTITSVSLHLLLKAMWHPWPGNVRDIKGYCQRINSCNAANTQTLKKTMDEAVFPHMALPPFHTDTISNWHAGDPQAIVNNLLYANLTQDMARHIEGGDAETANSILLLIHLASDPRFSSCASIHPSMIPLRRLESPDSFPPCYRILDGFQDSGPSRKCVSVVQFLSFIVKMARRTPNFSPAVCSSAMPVEKWMEWLAHYPLSLLPDHMAMATSVIPRPQNHPSGLDSSAGDASSCTTNAHPKIERDESSRLHARSHGGRPATLTDVNLVEILELANDKKLADRFTEATFWQTIRYPAGRPTYRNKKALSQRIRRIQNPDLRQRANSLFKYLFGSIA